MRHDSVLLMLASDGNERAFHIARGIQQRPVKRPALLKLVQKGKSAMTVHRLA